MRMGTPHYMSPEQIRGQDVDARSDLFSMAVTVYEYVTGAVPFDADSEFDVMSLIIQGRPRSVRALCPDIDPALESLLERGLRPDREQRFQTSEEFADALGRAGVQRPVSEGALHSPPAARVPLAVPAPVRVPPPAAAPLRPAPRVAHEPAAPVEPQVQEPQPADPAQLQPGVHVRILRWPPEFRYVCLGVVNRATGMILIKSLSTEKEFEFKSADLTLA
jgi:serine/threonine protein kinase